MNPDLKVYSNIDQESFGASTFMWVCVYVCLACVHARIRF